MQGPRRLLLLVGALALRNSYSIGPHKLSAWVPRVAGSPSCLLVRGGYSDGANEDEAEAGDDDEDDEDDEDEEKAEEELTEEVGALEEEADDEAAEESEDDASTEAEFDLGSSSLNKRVKNRVRVLGNQLPSQGEFHASMVARLEVAAARAKDFLREVKGSHSSEFECAMIKATRPNGEPAKEKHVARLVETIATFPMATAARPSSTDYYTMMLHKLWSRMAEKDWRSVAKAVYIFHRMALALDPELHREFAKRYSALRNAPHKKSHGLYFSSKTLTHVRPGDEVYAAFLGTYAAFVLDRFALFSGRYEECFEGQPSERQLQLLGSACRVLDRALRVDVEAGVTDQKVAIHCLELVVRDCFASGTKRGEDAAIRVPLRPARVHFSHIGLPPVFWFLLCCARVALGGFWCESEECDGGPKGSAGRGRCHRQGGS
jgi:hypothetical protein